MNKDRKFRLRSRARSFSFAIRGIVDFFLQEHNALLHGLATIALAVLIIFFRINGAELLALVIVTGGVWMAELLNTAIEQVMNIVSPGWHPKVKYIKDLAAAAVLVAAITALLVAGLIFIPRITH